jgi:uncharacterized glyoxalase superfamily protein PhnB
MRLTTRCVLLAVLTPMAGAAQPTVSAAPLSLASRHTMQTTTATYSVGSLAPVLIVDAVEPSIAFWTTKLGFTVENQVPGPDGKLIFASVKKGGVEIMYQTRASVIADSPKLADELNGRSVSLFITVPSLADLDAVEQRTAGAPVIKPRHDTFYGTTEFYIREPGGNVVGFAAPKGAA